MPKLKQFFTSLLTSLAMAAMSSHALASNSPSFIKGGKDMHYEVTTMDLPATPVLVIKGSAKVDNIGDVIGSIFGKLEHHMKEHNIAATGAPFTRTFSFKEGIFEFESGFPVAPAVTGEGSIIRTELPGGKVATTIHIGSQEESCNAYTAIEEWISAHHLKQVGAPWEVYLTDPGSSTPQQNKMQILFPIE